mmetsp:Transcript_35969/g.107437  ORF Transcript_35969/g.107437 Transcript_35969/m.107437 type:complete len:217 (-) Transcript_35969:1684-2334(-)
MALHRPDDQLHRPSVHQPLRFEAQDKQGVERRLLEAGQRGVGPHGLEYVIVAVQFQHRGLVLCRTAQVSQGEAPGLLHRANVGHVPHARQNGGDSALAGDHLPVLRLVRQVCQGQASVLQDRRGQSVVLQRPQDTLYAFLLQDVISSLAEGGKLPEGPACRLLRPRVRVVRMHGLDHCRHCVQPDQFLLLPPGRVRGAVPQHGAAALLHRGRSRVR